MSHRIRAFLTLGFLSGGAIAGGFARAGETGRVALPAATRGPVAIVFTPDGARTLVVEQDAAELDVVDRRTGNLLRQIPTGGREPGSVAVDSSHTALVANALSGSVSRLDLETGRTIATVPLRGEPGGIIVSRDGAHAFVSLAQLDEIAVLDLPGLVVHSRIPVGRRPRALTLTPDGGVLLAAAFRGGEVSFIDTATLKEKRRVTLPGVNLRGMAVSPDGAYAFITGQVPADTRVTWVANDVWANSVFRIDLRSGESSQGRLDLSSIPSPDPGGIVALDDSRVALSVSGRDEALLVRTAAGSNGYFDPAIQQRTSIGAHPRGMALSPDGQEVWVAAELGNTLTVLNSATLQTLRKIELPIPAKPDPTMAGRYLFGNNGLTAGGQFTCNSCHPGGSVDGLTWQFVHVPDGIPARNTRDLRGGVTRTAPFRWSGRDKDLDTFLQDEITGLLFGPAQPPDRLHAFGAMLASLPLPPNPNREADGHFTPAAVRGKALFEGKAGCAACHSGDLAGGTGRMAYVGTTPEGQQLDVPHLQGVFDTAPYLHDGRAKSLEEIFTRHNRLQKHGNAHQLSEAELVEVLRYVREL